MNQLEEGQVHHGFRTEALYLNGADLPMGARFVSQKTGFVVDLLRIQSVPQGFIWIKTPPTSSKGEPHACEHLLLGKGRRGRHVAALEDMSLATSTAYTSQIRTCYHFNTTAGVETFYTILEAKLQAFLHPDFTDEEIRREVCHLGVVENPDGSLSLEEKGTVYTEMISAYERPWHHFFDRIGDMVYGPEHPLSYSSGGDPAVMRGMVPEDMWSFIDRTHHLGNMGAIISLPDEVRLDAFLEKMAAILDDCRDRNPREYLTGIGAYELPGPDPAPAGLTDIVTYPSRNTQDQGYLLVQWPCELELDPADKMLLEFFMQAFAGTQTSNLYNMFINSETRVIDIGGTGLWSGVDDDLGLSPHVTFYGLDSGKLDQEHIEKARTLILEELARMASLEPGSENLKSFNERIRSLVLENRKELNRTLNSPPSFGARSGPAGRWLGLLEDLEEQDGFRKSLTYREPYEQVERSLDPSRNVWSELLPKARLLERRPYMVAARPDPEKLDTEAAAKQERMAGYLRDLQARYEAGDEQEAIRRYKSDFDAMTAELDALAAGDEIPGFIDNPPMTLDDQLRYETIELPGDVRMVASTFENMTSPYFGLALDLRVVPEDKLVYLSALPWLMTSIGVRMDGETIPYDEMEERLRREVLSLNAGFDHGFDTGRVELVLTGQGTNREELANVLRWMDAALFSAYLDQENLPRILDVLDQAVVTSRNRTKGSEEGWVNNPSTAYRFQEDPLFLSTRSFFTEAHHLWRVRWMLTDPGSEEDQEILSGVLGGMAAFTGSGDRDGILEHLSELERVVSGQESAGEETGGDAGAGFGQAGRASTLSETGRAVLKDAIRGLKSALGDIPDATLRQDWEYLCGQVMTDLGRPPAETLDELRSLLSLVSNADGARCFLVSSSADRDNAMDGIRMLVGKLDRKARRERPAYPLRPRIVERLRDREGGAPLPVYAGLVFEDSRNGVLLFSARRAGRYDTSEESLLRCLSGKTYGGGGPHGIFMSTWAAGLAYSNGYSYSQESGRVSYYAERCPDVSQTMKFVVDLLKKSEEDPRLAEYAIAQVFGPTRAPSTYESRGRGMAADLADGVHPEMVREFREAILELRDHPDLYKQLRKRMEEAYGPVLIGYGDPLSQSENGVFFLIGPEEQFLSLEEYIRSAEGEDRTVYRLYPRDFWLRAAAPIKL